MGFKNFFFTDYGHRGIWQLSLGRLRATHSIPLSQCLPKAERERLLLHDLCQLNVRNNNKFNVTNMRGVKKGIEGRRQGAAKVRAVRAERKKNEKDGNTQQPATIATPVPASPP